MIYLNFSTYYMPMILGIHNECMLYALALYFSQSIFPISSVQFLSTYGFYEIQCSYHISSSQ